MRRRQLALALALVATSTLAWAWTPERFEVFCGQPAWSTGLTGSYDRAFYADRTGKDDVLEDPSCLSPERLGMIQRMSAHIVAAYRDLGFANPSPTRLGPVVDGVLGEPVVRIYVNDDPEFAYTVSPCTSAGVKMLDRLSFVVVDTHVARTSPAPFLYYVLAHELFHVVQNAQTFKIGAGTKSCMIDHWVSEGTADAISTHLTRLAYPGFTPALGPEWVRNYVGLRRFDINLTAARARAVAGVREEANVLGYRASALWRHLGETYMREDWRYLVRFLGVANNSAGARDDWLRWLDRLTRADREIRMPLAMTYAAFLTDYASWGAEKYEDTIGESVWLREVFGACTVVPLNPRQPVRFVTLQLEPLAGDCVRVSVGGLEPDAFASVRVVARDADTDRLDELHLGLASSTAFTRFDGLDFDGFDCHTYMRTARSGSDPCTFSPFVGVAPDLAPGEVVKTWRTGPQRPVEGGGFENLYVVTRAPLEPRDALHQTRTPQTVRLQFGLQVAALDTPATQRSPATRRPGVISGGGEVPFLPMVDPPLRSDGPSALSGLDLGDASRFASGALPVVPDLSDGRFHGFTVWWGDLAPEDDEYHGFDTTFQLQILFDEHLPGGLPELGRTGSYQAWLMGFGDARAAGLGVSDDGGLARMMSAMVSNNPAGMGYPLCNYPYAPLPEDEDEWGAGFRWFLPPDDMERMGPLAPSVEVEVVAFEADLLIIRFSGTLGYVDEDDEGWPLCLDPQPFRGEVVVPFGAFHAGSGLSLVETPGSDLEYAYRMGFLFGYPDEDDEPELYPSSEAGRGADGGSVLVPCDCSCDALLSIALAMEEIDDDDDDDLSPELMASLQCVDTCGMGALVACLMSQDD